ncbi:MAG: DUF5666 domain-containing protein [bacterium]
MKKIIPLAAVLVLSVGGAFYGGMKYQQTKSPLGEFSQGQRQQMFQGNVGASFRQGAAGRTAGGMGFLSGEVISIDSQSLTLKISDGSSKIVFFSDSTQISKTAEASKSDIEIGRQITVSGGQNSDGSYTAQSIQLRPGL